MSKVRHPSFDFEKGYVLRRSYSEFGRWQHRRVWCLIGRLDVGTPFMLDYSRGLTRWTSPGKLTAGLRKKILDGLREVRFAEAIPEFITSYDMIEADELDFDTSSQLACEVERNFYKDVWQREYMGFREEDFIDLVVPFEDRDQVKALGARWSGSRRAWTVHKDLVDNLTPWLKSTNETAPATPGP